MWDFCKYSIQAESLFDCYIDGERERTPYEGDTVINQLGLFCCDVNFRTAKNTLEHFFRYGRYTWPTEWRLLTPVLVRDYRLYSGDSESVGRWLPMLDEKLLLDRRDANNLLNQKVYRSAFPDDRLADIVDYP